MNRRPAIDLRSFVAAIPRVLERHASAVRPGAYRRWRPGVESDTDASTREADGDAYGCADAANLRYTIGVFPGDAPTREACVDVLRSLQDDDGMFRDPTHAAEHTTAHCIAALELFDAQPVHRSIAALEPLLEPAAMRAWLDGLAWRSDPWRASHVGAGVHTALTLTGAADRAWEDAYFDWLGAAVDPNTGLLRRGRVPARSVELFPHLAGTFHYLFAFEAARRPYPAPAALVDTCLRIEAEGAWPFGTTFGFAEIDWIYCLARGVQQSAHRFETACAALERVGRRLFALVETIGRDAGGGSDDLHALFGTTCAFAELQRALPGLVVTDRALRLVLDRRPFI